MPLVCLFGHRLSRVLVRCPHGVALEMQRNCLGQEQNVERPWIIAMFPVQAFAIKGFHAHDSSYYAMKF